MYGIIYFCRKGIGMPGTIIIFIRFADLSDKNIFVRCPFVIFYVKMIDIVSIVNICYETAVWLLQLASLL